MIRGPYNTKQRDKIFQIIEKYGHDFLIKDLYEEVKEDTSLTTVYRLVDQLVEEGILNKCIGSDQNTYYQYMKKCDCESHFYLKCDQCGSFTHVECDHISELLEHIQVEHQFHPDEKQIIIHGVCKKCYKGD